MCVLNSSEHINNFSQMLYFRHQKMVSQEGRRKDAEKVWGVQQMLTCLTKGGWGGEMLTLADKGGRGGLDPNIFLT